MQLNLYGNFIFVTKFIKQMTNNNKENGEYSSWAKRTIFKDAEWVFQLDLCNDWPERASIVNQIFKGKFQMNERNGSITQIGTATPEEQWGLAVIFVNITHEFRFCVKKEDFDEELLEDYYFRNPYSERPAYPIRIEESPQEILFSVQAYPGYPPYSEDLYTIKGMLFDFGKENLLSEHWNTYDRYLQGTFDKKGHVIGKITL